MTFGPFRQQHRLLKMTVRANWEMTTLLQVMVKQNLIYFTIWNTPLCSSLGKGRFSLSIKQQKYLTCVCLSAN
jgi:hypothetical protein